MQTYILNFKVSREGKRLALDINYLNRFAKQFKNLNLPNQNLTDRNPVSVRFRTGGFANFTLIIVA